MGKRERNAICTLLTVCVALLIAALPIFSGSVAVADNADWTETALGGVYNVLDIEALDANTAWAVGTIGRGGVILKTTDGGATWVRQKTLTGVSPAQPLTSISVVDANTAWASGYRVLLKTTDGGANWNVVFSSPSANEGVLDICAVGADNAWAIYIDAMVTSHVFKTSDGGATWVEVYSRLYASGGLVRISAVDEVTAWAAGGAVLDAFTNTGAISPGTIVKTSDMGATWQEQTPAGAPSFLNAKACDASTAWVSGQGVIMHTTDGGANWAAVYSQAGTEFWGLAVNDGTTIWAAGLSGNYPNYGGCILKSLDGGSTWQTQYTSTTRWLCSLDAADAAHAWVGSTGNLLQDIIYSSGNSVILRTVNGGDARPDITAIAPASGNAGDTVTISGCDFGAERGSSQVFFNGTEAASYLSWSDGAITAKVPDGLSGRCAVTVVCVAGTSNSVGFTIAGPVSIASIDPASASQFGFFMDATMSGSGFQPGAAVSFVKGSIVLGAYNINVVSETELACTVGTFGVEPGAYDVVVTNPDGGTATLAGAFTITAPCGSGATTAVLVLGGMLGLLSLGHGLNRRRRR